MDEFFSLPKSKSAEPVDLERADKLRAAVVRYSHIRQSNPAKWNRNSWAKQFGKLRKQYPANWIDAVLSSHCKMLEEVHTYAIRVFCAEKFVTRFRDLEESCRRSEQVDGGEITPEAFQINEQVWVMGWPNDSAKRLPDAIQASLTALKKFQAQLSALPEQYRRFGSILWNEMGPPDHYLVAWFTGVHKRVRKRAKTSKWDGTFRPYVWHVGQWKFDKVARTCAERYFGFAEKWVEIREMMQRKSEGKEPKAHAH